MAVVQERDRGLVLGVIERALGLVALHHGDRLGTQGAAQALELGGEMRDVGDRVGEDQGAQRFGVGERVLDGEPAAPGMAEQMHPAEAQRPADGLGLRDVAADGPQGWVGRAVRGAGAELVEGHHAEAVLGQAGMSLAQVVAGQAGAAIEAEERLVAPAELVGDDRVAVDPDLVPAVGRDLVPHRLRRPLPWRGPGRSSAPGAPARRGTAHGSGAGRASIAARAGRGWRRWPRRRSCRARA